MTSLRKVAKDIANLTLDKLREKEDVLVYHDIGFQSRIENNIFKIGKSEGLTEEAMYLLDIAKNVFLISETENKNTKVDFEGGTSLMNKVAERIAEMYTLADNHVDSIKDVLSCYSPLVPPQNLMQKVFKDAFVMDYLGKKGRQRLQLFYEELMLRGYSIGKHGWVDMISNFLNTSQVFTNYGSTHIQPGIDKLKKVVLKEKKEIEKRKDNILKKELNISDQEIKTLKKDLEKSKKRDDRGIQTLFRTTLKNHYTLNEMVDKKANIMITVNSIILSLLLGGIIGIEMPREADLTMLPKILLLPICGSSIFYAILSIRPVKTQGDFSESDIRNKQGNLLYFGNFHNMSFRDFEWAFLQLLNDKDYLYSSLIRDYYHLGEGLNKKYQYLRKSLNVFLYGLLVVVLIHFIIQISLIT